jgi:hypothetical protein
VEGDATVSARDRLFNDIWDMRSAKEKNALIDAVLAEHAHELAERLRDERPQHNPDWTCWEAAADLIDPTKDTPR